MPGRSVYTIVLWGDFAKTTAQFVMPYRGVVSNPAIIMCKCPVCLAVACLVLMAPRPVSSTMPLIRGSSGQPDRRISFDARIFLEHGTLKEPP
mmetsp:Transcript_30684/g.77564  ORF Transcript_30684/g.77564 Transcript_30684/m.77564 type:complete len:93 (-) Transcript_30684:11-289(-)